MDIFEKKEISPMLLTESAPFNDENFIFELKLDGIRCIAYLEKGSTVLRNKRNKEVTGIYPELSNLHKLAKKRVILDGELIVVKEGKPNFFALQKRSLMTDEFKIKLSSRFNRVSFVAYDILYFGNEEVTKLALTERKRLLESAVTEGEGLSISRYIENEGVAFFRLAELGELEGIVAKRKDSLYFEGIRSQDWIKIKVMQEEDLNIVGYSLENGEIKQLHLASYDEEGELCYRGKIHLGVSASDKEIILKAKRCGKIFDIDEVVFIEPSYVGTVKYMHKTHKGGMRQAVFKGIRED